MDNLKHMYSKYAKEVWIAGASGALVCITLVFSSVAFKQTEASAASIAHADSAGLVEPSQKVLEAEQSPTLKRQIIVDISGAVRLPDAYEVPEGSRLVDVLEKAGGLSASAARDFFNRNYNRAAVLTDQQKIYVPRQDEVEQGIFLEGRYVIGQEGEEPESQPGQPVDSQTSGFQEDKISVNSASQASLEELSGIGEVTARKIIDNRPYASLDELVSKKVVSEKVYQGIQAEVSL